MMNHPFALLVASVTLLAALWLPGVQAVQTCGTPVIWRNENYTCPLNAICADVFSFNRNWYNGTTCSERRVLNNCLCPGNLPCPTDNEAHMVRTSNTQTRYLCQPVCNLDRCPDTGSYTAMTNYKNSPRFHGRTYQELHCRCKAHMTRLAGHYQAERTWHYTYNFTTLSYNTYYRCRRMYGRVPRNWMDPCDL